jgi:hypothetical protein
MRDRSSIQPNAECGQLLWSNDVAGATVSALSAVSAVSTLSAIPAVPALSAEFVRAAMRATMRTTLR